MILNKVKTFQRLLKSNKKELFSLLDLKYGLGRIEKLININWFNPFCTIWVNLRSLPIMQAIRFPIWVYGRPRIYSTSGHIFFKCKVKPGLVKFNMSRPGSPGLMSIQAEFDNRGTIFFCGKGQIDTGTKILVDRKGHLSIGSNFKICDMTVIGCSKEISIGDNSWIVHNCQVLDSNYHYVANLGKGIIPKCTKEIIIGNNVWVCNSSNIVGGAVIPDFTIVASGSLVNRDFSELEKGSLIGGVPAKFIASGMYKIDNQQLSLEIGKYYENNECPYKITNFKIKDIL